MNKISTLKTLDDPISPRLGYLLRRASVAMMADLGERLATIDLKPVEGTILVIVGANAGCIQSDLGRTLGIKRANMVPLIARLSERGYLEKSPVDGRSLALSLTESGQKAMEEVTRIIDEHEALFASLLGNLDVESLRDTLTAIAQQADPPA